MASTQLPAPLAEGHLAKRPLAHLLVHILRKELSGTLVVWPEPGPDGERPKGQDRILFRAGRPMAARLLRPYSALDRGMLPLFSRVDAPFAFYGIDLVGVADDVVRGQVDPLALIAASLRGSVRSEVIDAVLAPYDGAVLRLSPSFPLSRYQLLPEEEAVVQLLRASPATVEQLSTKARTASVAQKVAYLLFITGALQPLDAATAAALQSAPGMPWEGNAQAEPGATEASTAATGAPSDFPRLSLAPEPATGGDGNAGAISLPPPPPTPSAARAQAKASSPAPAPATAGPPPHLSAELKTRWTQIVGRAESIDNEDYYTMLGVERQASTSTIQKAYYAAAKEWHPDRLPRELSELKASVDTIFHHLNQAERTLTNDASRAEYLKQVQAGGGTPAADRELNAIVTAAMEFQKVEILVRRKAWKEALALLDEVQALNPKDPDFPSMQALVLLQMTHEGPPDLAEVMACVDRALSLSDRNVRAHYVKGLVLKQMGDNAGALTQFKKTLDIDPKHLDATREVRLAQMRGLDNKAPKARKSTRPSAPPPGQDDGGLLGRLFKRK